MNHICQLMFSIIDFLKNLTGSYGVAIILLTAAIKIIFWPLTHKSTVSMNKMKLLQPKLKDLKKDFGQDRHLLQQKTMELYKSEKINPISGCLPILIQIPVFIILFYTLKDAPELKHVSFLWITDLSKPDTVARILNIPINPLAIIMAVTMLIQQMTAPSAMSSEQAKMMMFLPLIFLFVLYSMPSGLTLYWTVNQILTIIQQLVSNQVMKKNASSA